MAERERAWIMIAIMFQIDVLRRTDNTNFNKLYMLDMVGRHDVIFVTKQ